MAIASRTTTSSPVTYPEVPSATEPDWSREDCDQWWDPSKQLLKAVRDYQNGGRRGGVVGRAKQKLAVLRHRFWSVIAGADIPLNARGIEGGLILPHPQGVVIHPEAQIGPNCLLFQQVTIGTGPKPGTPRIGGHVDVGAGAKILGGIVIGDHAVIGANAVVIDDVPPWCVAVGVPAVVKRRRRPAAVSDVRELEPRAMAPRASGVVDEDADVPSSGHRLVR